MEEIFKPKTRQEIADGYGICRRTLYRWLKKEGIKLEKGLMKRKKLELIYSIHGIPPKFEKEEIKDAWAHDKMSQFVPKCHIGNRS